MLPSPHLPHPSSSTNAAHAPCGAVAGAGAQRRQMLTVAACPVLLVVSGLGGCGAGASPATTLGTPGAASSASEPAVFPVTVAAANGPVTIPRRPRAVVSLSPSATEMLYGIGAGQQVKAVDDKSDYPAAAPKTALSGYQLDVEAITTQDPDLVVMSDDAGPVAAAAARQLRSLGIPTIIAGAAATQQVSYDQIMLLGQATGHGPRAVELVRSMKSRIGAAIATAPATTKGLKIYHEIDPTLFSATSRSFIGRVYGAFGLDNIADRAPAAAGPYPQLSAEYVLEHDPDLIFLGDTDCCAQDRGRLLRRPGWSRIAAVRNGHVYGLQDAEASRWGPRTVDLYQDVANALRHLTP